MKLLELLQHWILIIAMLRNSFHNVNYDCFTDFEKCSTFKKNDKCRGHRAIGKKKKKEFSGFRDLIILISIHRTIIMHAQVINS